MIDTKTVRIEVSIGELLDKISILQLKRQHIKTPDKLNNIQKEYNLLMDKLPDLKFLDSIELYKDLHTSNRLLWEYEDHIRSKEALKEFDDEFIQIARNIYFENDRRAIIKKQINIKFESGIIEEKSY